MDLYCVITRQFLAGVPLKSFDWKVGEDEWLKKDDVWQRNILNSTLLNPLLTSFPVSTRYKRSFIKALISKLEVVGRDQPILDQLYEVCAALMISADDRDEETFYRIYTSRDLTVPIRESGSFVVNGSTGLVTWQAGKALAEWAVLNRHRFHNRKVLELGCGLGLTGIVVCKTCQARSYVFTDSHPQVLTALQHNLHVNHFHRSTSEAENVKNECVWSHEETLASVVQLNWDDVQQVEDVASAFQPQVILAADVVYDASVIPSLVGVLRRLMAVGDVTALVACTVRAEETLRAFVLEAGARGLRWVKHTCPMTHFFYDKVWDVQIFELTVTVS